MTNSSLRVAKVDAPSKMPALRSRVKSLAATRGAGEKLPTVAQLCAMLEVSPTTLNLALRELEAQGVVVRRNGVGLFVGTVEAPAKTIALICDANHFRGAGHSPFWDLLVEEARARASLSNENFQLHFSHRTEANDSELQPALVKALLEGEVQGVLGIGLSKGAADWLDGNGVPFVAFAGTGQARVDLNLEAFCQIGVAALAQRGCKNVGLWMPMRPFLNLDSWYLNWYLPARTALFRAALERHGLAFDTALVRDNHHLTPNVGDRTRITHQEQGFHTATAAWQGAKRPDGVLIGDDLMCVGALAALSNAGVRPAHDLQIVTHANRGSSTLLGHEASLTRLEYDPREIALAMFEQLEAAMSGTTPPEVTLVHPTLVA